MENGYFGLSVYQADGSQSRGSFVNGLENSGASVTMQTYDVSRTAYQLYAGYRYHDYFAFEFGWLDLGDAKVDLNATTVDTAALNNALSNSYPISGDGWTLSNRFDYPLSERFDLSAEVGLYVWDGEISLSGANINPDLDGGTDPLFGIGVAYQVTDNINTKFEFKRLLFDGQEVDLLGGNVSYRF